MGSKKYCLLCFEEHLELYKGWDKISDSTKIRSCLQCTRKLLEVRAVEHHLAVLRCYCFISSNLLGSTAALSRSFEVAGEGVYPIAFPSLEPWPFPLLLCVLLRLWMIVRPFYSCSFTHLDACANPHLSLTLLVTFLTRFTTPSHSKISGSILCHNHLNCLPAVCHSWWIWPWREEQSQDVLATPPSTCTTPWLQNSTPRLHISHLDWNFAPCSTTSRRASDQTLGDSFLPIVAHRLPLQIPDIHTRAQIVLSLTLCDEFWWLRLNGLYWEVFSNFASTTILFSAVIHQCCSAEVKLKMVSQSS